MRKSKNAREDCAFIMYRIYLGKKKNFYKHKQLFLLPFCYVGLVVLIRIRVRIRVRVRARLGLRLQLEVVVWFGTTMFALGEPAVHINWTETCWCPLNCSCTDQY